MQTVVGRHRWTGRTDKSSLMRLADRVLTPRDQEGKMLPSGRNNAALPSDEGKPQPQGHRLVNLCTPRVPRGEAEGL